MADKTKPIKRRLHYIGDKIKKEDEIIHHIIGNLAEAPTMAILEPEANHLIEHIRNIRELRRQYSLLDKLLYDMVTYRRCGDVYKLGDNSDQTS